MRNNQPSSITQPGTSRRRPPLRQTTSQKRCRPRTAWVLSALIRHSATTGHRPQVTGGDDDEDTTEQEVVVTDARMERVLLTQHGNTAAIDDRGANDEFSRLQHSDVH